MTNGLARCNLAVSPARTRGDEMSKSKQLLRRRSSLLIGVAIAAASMGWTTSPSLAADLTPQEAQKIAVDAYIYGYPLMTSDVTEKAFINTVAPDPGTLQARIRGNRAGVG